VKRVEVWLALLALGLAAWRFAPAAGPAPAPVEPSACRTVELVIEFPALGGINYRRQSVGCVWA